MEKLIKPITNSFVVASDYNWLPENIEDSWVHKYSNNYLIYDKYHRYKESLNIKWQRNVGQNIYDMFYFIITNYDNLPEFILFCRAALLFPKDTGTPRLDSSGKKLSNGNCSEEYFLKICNNKSLTEINDFFLDPWRFNGTTNKYTEDGGYLERNDNWYFCLHPSKYYNNLDNFFNDIYDNYTSQEYIRFSPGANYIVPRSNILKYSKKFYEFLLELVSWNHINAESHMMERALYTIFSSNFNPRNKFI